MWKIIFAPIFVPFKFTRNVLGNQIFIRNVPISIRVGGKIKSKMSLIRMSLFMVERKGSNEKGTKSLSLLFFRGHPLVSLN